ncbi:hypothetical protein J6590_068855 [Homalodisca vitripennis]|nr:hypothetical protein J6590_068855 [Homalodisca vitripennis]
MRTRVLTLCQRDVAGLSCEEITTLRGFSLLCQREATCLSCVMKSMHGAQSRYMEHRSFLVLCQREVAGLSCEEITTLRGFSLLCQREATCLSCVMKSMHGAQQFLSPVSTRGSRFVLRGDYNA